MDRLKICAHCGDSKPLVEFNVHATNKDGRRSDCRLCQRLELKEWRKNNPAENAARDKRARAKYRALHLEEERARIRRNGPSNKARRRAAKTGVGGSHTPKELEALKLFYGWSCVACGLTEAEITTLNRKLVGDHVLPITKKGSNSITNIQPLCHGVGGCNNRKTIKHIDYRPDAGLCFAIMKLMG